MVNWRKALRAIHRDLGYACVGLTLVYAISGIAVNHVHEWNPNYEISRVQSNIGPVAHEVPVSEDTVSVVLTRLGLPTVHKTTFQPDPDSLQIIQDQTSILVDLNTGDTLLKRIATRPVLYETNVLHLNRPKSIWTWVADLFAVGHRAWFQEELWRTPLVMSGPGVREDAVVDALSENLDLFPTVLDAFGLAVPQWVAGHSLLDPGAPPRAQVLGYGFGTTAIRESTGLKLIEHDPRRYGLPEGDPPPYELLDPVGEPDEMRNLASQRPADTARLAAAIGAWRGEVQREISTEASAADTEALRRMGYVGDE